MRPSRPSRSAAKRSSPSRGAFFQRLWQRPWTRYALAACAGLCVIGLIVISYFWVHYGRIIDAKLGGEQRAAPRIFGRAFDIKAGVPATAAQITQRLNDAGYIERPKLDGPGEYEIAGPSILIATRPAQGAPPETVRVDFTPKGSAVAGLFHVPGGAPPAAPPTPAPKGARAPAAPKPQPIDQITLEAPLLTALAPGEKARHVPLAGIPKQMADAVIAIEDRRFFEHPGVDPIGAVRALVTNLRGDKQYLVGGSTLTQQIVKNTFLTPQKTIRRKLQEQFMALVLESRFTKNQILELYLNTVTLGQRGPFEIHGVAEGARIFFGKDVRNLTLGECATIAGVIHSPSFLSPFRNPDRARDRRNVVLKEMADDGFATSDAATKATAEPLKVATRALEDEAPYFVDYISQIVDDSYGNAIKNDSAIDVYTTLDLQLQRTAQQAVGEGVAQLDKTLAAKKKKEEAEVALIAIDPRTGEILAFVGGRAYNQSQFDRVVQAHRQPGSTFKPFVYLTAFEKTAEDGTADLTPGTIVVDEPTTFQDGDKDYTPTNYQNEYDGPITLRRALALSRNIVAIKVAQQAGYDRVAALWQKIGVGTPAKPYPSIALGVFEATPLEMATAYTVFPNQGSIRPVTGISRVVENGKPQVKPIARPDATYLVTNMMRSVMNEGTGAGARGNGFTLNAAGKSGTTNDLRDAWFIGFTPELLTVVWVGFDDNQPISLSGSQAALPIWTSFMKRALAGHPDQQFQVPDGVTFADIDKDTGKLATPNCPKVINEAFLSSAVPHEYCDVHGGYSILDRIGGFFRKIIR
jgi:penicillin-binding protein 1B